MHDEEYHSPWHGKDFKLHMIIVSGMIQQTIDMMFMERDRCCEKNIVDLLSSNIWMDGWMGGRD